MVGVVSQDRMRGSHHLVRGTVFSSEMAVAMGHGRRYLMAQVLHLVIEIALPFIILFIHSGGERMIKREEILRDNIKNLIIQNETQKKLADALGLDNIKQQDISAIALGKRTLSSEYIRLIEESLSIPYGWLDRYRLNVNSYRLIRKYRQLDDNTKQLINDLSSHMISQEEKTNIKDKG